MSTTIVPHDQLQPETLTALIEEFVTRQGAVHGHGEVEPTAQIAAVRDQLQRGLTVIVFDEETESCTVLTDKELAAREKASEAMYEERRVEPADGADMQWQGDETDQRE